MAEVQGMNIAGREISPNHPPYVIAEMSCNHNGSFDRAVQIIMAARHAGADAVKLQCFDPASIAAARGGADYILASGPWHGMTLGELYAKAHTPREWFPDLMRHAAENGITLFSSVFDESAVEFCAGLGMPALKISSFDLTNLSLIRKAASTGLPLIISTGMGAMADVGRAIDAAKPAGPDLAVMHCVSEYPCPIEKANLDRISALKREANVVGFSDHTDVASGSIAAVAAIARGACIIEKHFTLSRLDGGLDAKFSIEPHEMRYLTLGCNLAWRASGSADDDNVYSDLRVQAA